MAPTNTSVAKKRLLSKLYKKTLSTPQKLLVEAKKSIPSITLSEVQKFLHDQPNYVRTTKMSYKKYPRSLTLRHIIVAEPYQEMFMDTWYLKRSIMANFCFVMIDGFTKFLWVRYAKSLNASTAKKAIQNVIESIPVHVQSVATDRGPEFKGQFSLYLASENIRQIFMSGQHKTSIAERIIR
jgi:hypothetical protein